LGTQAELVVLDVAAVVTAEASVVVVWGAVHVLLDEEAGIVVEAASDVVLVLTVVGGMEITDLADDDGEGVRAEDVEGRVWVGAGVDELEGGDGAEGDTDVEDVDEVVGMIVVGTSVTTEELARAEVVVVVDVVVVVVVVVMSGAAEDETAELVD